MTNILQRNNVTVFGNDSVSAPTMVFAHGFGCDQNMWRFVTPAFKDDYRIVLFDYVGCGRSETAAYSPRRYSSLDGYAQDLIDVCVALDLSGVTLVAHSVSSMIGVIASRQQPELFDRMILIGPSPCYINDGPAYTGGFERADLEGLLDMMDKNYIGWASFLAPVVMKNPDTPELTAELQDSFCSTDPTTARGFAAATFFSDNRADLSGVTVPTLVLQCTDDAIAPTEVGEYVARNTPGSEYRLMEATGHCPHMSHPAETVSIIKDYLASSAMVRATLG